MRKTTGMHLGVIVDGEVPNIRVTKLDGDVSNTRQTVARGVATVLVGSKTEEAQFVFVDGHLYSDLGQPGTYTDFGNGASINAEMIWNQPIENTGKDGQPRADHAVVVTGVDTGKGIVHLNDSGSKDGRDEQIPMAMFVKAWATSHNFMSVTQETRN